MKTRHLPIFIGIAIVTGILFYSTNSDQKKAQYEPRTSLNKQGTSIHGAKKWLSKIRNNQLTGTIEIQHIEKAQKQIKALRKKNNKSFNLQWQEMGPDNVGGRTRALLIDNENPNLFFAGSVAGGLWKSTSAGSSWEKVNYEGDELSDGFTSHIISSICQTVNGDIYFGTGEGFYEIKGSNTDVPQFPGQGIWKSTDRGETWSRLESTWTTILQKEAFQVVYKLEAHPTDNNIIYASTIKGLRVSTDGGETWSNPVSSGIEDFEGVCTDVEVASDGSLITSLNNLAYIKRAGDASFTLVCDTLANDPDTTSDKLPTNAGRLEFDFAPSNPEYVYCGAAKSKEEDEELYNIYKSEDKGMTWRIVGPGGSEDFQPYGVQGIFDNLIKVYPDNENVILVGGLDLWVWAEGLTWAQQSYHGFPDFHPLYLHADQHELVYHPENYDIMYIASDGGITRLIGGVNGTGYLAMNRNYNVTQFFSVAFDGFGKVAGGTQDNGTQYITLDGNTEMAATRILGDDGGYTVISQLNPNLIYATSQYGKVMRANDYTGEFQYFYSGQLLVEHLWTEPGYVDVGTDPEMASYVTPIALWETHNDIYSSDSVIFVAKRDYSAGDTLMVKSYNIYNKPLYNILDRDYSADDTIKTKDPYGSLFVLGMADQLWITRMATNFNESAYDWGWWRMIPEDTLSTYVDAVPLGGQVVEKIAISNDGNHIFFSTDQNRVYRVSNVSMARTRNNADMIYFADFSVPPVTEENKVINVQQIHNFEGRSVTDIACDPQIVNNVVITLGNYGNEEYVYYSTNAATTTSEDGNFFPVQGDLPAMPVYSAVIHYKNSAKVIVGTEYGVFGCQNVLNDNPEWTEENNGMEQVPTFMIRQQTWPNWRSHTENHGHLFIGTHGRGIFKSTTLQGPVDVKEVESNTLHGARVYPNPVNSFATISFNLDFPSDVVIRVYDLQGKLIKTNLYPNQSMGNQQCEIDTDDLLPGTYIANIRAGNNRTSAKFVKF